MLQSAVQSVNSRLSAILFQSLDYIGIPSAPDGREEESAASPWYSRVYRRFSVKFGNKLPYILLGVILLVLFVIALLAQANEIPLHVSHETTTNLRGSNVNPSSSATSTTTSSSPGNQQIAKNNKGSFYFSVFVSFLFWIAMIQMVRVLRRAALQSHMNTGNQSDPSRRNSMQVLAHIMQLGRAGGAQGALSNRMRMALLNRDFNGNDFEMLQALDDDPDEHRGAQQELIDRLPLHVMTASELEENQAGDCGGSVACNICLAPYEAGDEVRTIPCMHKYHRNCIDTWLRERALCPICKHPVVA